MSHAFTNALAAFAAVVLAFASIGTIVTVPHAQASDAIGMAELA